MFLAEVKTLGVKALRTTLDSDYPVADFRNINVTVEYPIREEQYPAVWVDFIPVGDLEIAGVDHREYAPGDDATGGTRRYTRWKYQGHMTYTVVALTSLERDRLFDEVVRIMAFGRQSVQLSEFRNTIEDNDLIACNFDFDGIGVTGSSASQGTPWGSSEVIYEITISMEALGEFVSDDATGTLVPLSAIVVVPYVQGTTDPTLTEADQGAWI